MIFIVDDDASVRSSLSRLLRSAGYPLLAFGSAEEYLDAVTGASTYGNGPSPNRVGDCLLLDLHLPGMGGRELQQILNGRERRIPVIVLSATEDTELRARVLAAGAVRVLRKPCTSKVLFHAIAEAIDQGAPPDGFRA